MNDRELLEKAARAGGVTHPEVLERHLKEWNSLADDGDAFRLMVELEINVQHDAVDIWATTLRETAIENRGKDACAATRRAITRAAAAIGDKL